MNLGTLAFLAPFFPCQNVNFKRTRPLISATAGKGQDQWEQFESSNREHRRHQLEIARGVSTRERDHQIFLTNSSKPMFTSASKRFMDGIRTRFSEPDRKEMDEKRLWVVEAIADDTFGTLRGVPYPPRVAVMESIGGSAEGAGADSERDTAVCRWTDALNRAGTALSTLQNYYVEYAVWGGASSFDNFYELEPGYLVACEMLNASWNRIEAIKDMRQLLLSYAEECVKSGKVAMYQVLQSVEEPTMFKTVEAYTCMDDLRDHMEKLDGDFAENMKKHRAAVSRVRQLHRCLDSLHSFSRGMVR